jgi:hypothetical protein
VFLDLFRTSGIAFFNSYSNRKGQGKKDFSDEEARKKVDEDEKEKKLRKTMRNIRDDEREG